MINFVVEKIYPSFDDDVRNHDNYIDFICTTPGCVTAEDPNHWGPANKLTLKQLIYSKHVKLITKQEYNTDGTSFYLINMKNNDDFINQEFWNNMPNDTFDFLRNTNVPILLFYPLESMSDLLIDKQNVINLIKKRNSYNLKNKLVILTLSNFVDLHNNTISLKDIDVELEDIHLVPSFSFLIRYASPMTAGGKNVVELFLEQKRLTNQNHNLKYKKHNFVCFNHIHRFNRALLLQALFLNKNLWEHNIITCRHDTTPSLNFLKDHILDFLKKEKDYFNENLRLTNNLVSSDNKELSHFLNSIIKSLNDGIVYPKVIIDNPESLNDYYDLSFFEDTFFSLITETYNYVPGFNAEVPMITEKTVKSIINFHPFIIFGHAHSHALLQKLGFRTYEYMINLPSDGQKGNITVIERAFNLINALNAFDYKNLSLTQFLKIQEDIDYNYKHLNNTDWCKLQCDLLMNV